MQEFDLKSTLTSGKMAAILKVRNCTFTEFEKYATKTTDQEVLGKIRIVKTYHNALPSLITKIKEKCISDSKRAGMCMHILCIFYV